MQWLYRVDGGLFRASNSDSSITLLAGPSIIETMFIAARVSARTLDAVEHSRTIMERWSFVIFHRGGSRISVIANTMLPRLGDLREDSGEELEDIEGLAFLMRSERVVM